MIYTTQRIFSNSTMPLLSDIVDLEWTKQQTIVKYFQKADDDALIKMIDSLRAINLNANDMNYKIVLAQRLFLYRIVSLFTMNLYQQNSTCQIF